MSSGSELDEELLQVAGQARKKGTSSTAKRKRAQHFASDSSEEVSLDEESDWEAEEMAARTEHPRKMTKARGGDPSAAEEDTGAIDEEALIADEEDRKRLAAMTELEREMELADRAERLQQEMQRKQLLRAAEGDAALAKGKGRSKDREAGAGTGPRRSGREIREETAKKSAMEELRAARERKARGKKAYEDDEDDEDQAAGASGRGPSHKDAEDGEAYTDDDYVDDGQRGPLRWEPRDEYADEEAAQEAAFEDVKGIQVRRHRLEEWFAKPFFRETLSGCVVRLAVPLPGADQMTYMVAQVSAVEERPPGNYKYNPNGGHPWKSPYPFGQDGARTSLWLKVRRGKSDLYWPMAQVSNSSITDEEFLKWHKVCESVGMRQITRGEVDVALAKLTAAETYVYTAEDVARLLEEKRSKGHTPRNFAIERARLERARDAAAESGDQENFAAAEAALGELEAAAAATAAARRGAGASMEQLNRKNADRNFQVALKGGAEGGGGGAGADRNDAGKVGAGTLDPFSRRVTRPMIYWNTQRQDGGGGGGAEESKAEDAEVDAQKGLEHHELDGRGGAAVQDDGARVVDLSDLDLTLLNSSQRVNPLSRRLLGRSMRPAVEGYRPGSVGVAGRPTVSLDEYRQRMHGQHAF